MAQILSLTVPGETVCDGGRAGLLHLCAQGALWSGTFPGGQAGLPLWWTGKAPPSWGGQRGQGHDHSPVQRTSVLPVLTVGHVHATCTVTTCEGNPPAPRLPWARSCRHPQAGLLVAWGPQQMQEL